MIQLPAQAWVALLCTLCMAAGCAKHVPAAGTQATVSQLRGMQRSARSNCPRSILRVEDLIGILNVPIKSMQPLLGDAQSCEFLTDSYPEIIVTIRPGLGRSTVDDWAAGKMALNSRPLLGVGDSAVWLDTLLEVVAEKNALLCDIQVRGGDSDVAVNPDALPAALGVLCNKIFAAY